MLKLVTLIPRALLAPFNFGCLVLFFKRSGTSEQGCLAFKSSNNYSKIAICVHGPCADKERVLSLLQRLRKMFPQAHIVYRTSRFLEVDSFDVERVEPPEVVGFGYFNNVVKQLLGCLYSAVEHGCEYSLKVRDDLEIRNPDALDYLCSLARDYPGADDKARIWFSHLHSRINIPFHVCDFVLFGRTEDLIGLYESVSLHEYSVSKKEYEQFFYGKRKLFDIENISSPHLSIGIGAYRYLCGKAVSHNYEVAWREWNDFVCENVGFFNLYDIGIYFDRDESILAYPDVYFDEEFYNMDDAALMMQITFVKWRVLCELRRQGRFVDRPFLWKTRLY